MSKMIQTVTGPVPADRLGRCLSHQHVLFGYPGWEGAVLAPFQWEQTMDKCVSVLNDAKERCRLQTVVDATPADCGRKVDFLKEVSEKSGVNIVASSGYYYEGEGAPAYFKFRMAYGNAKEEIYRMMLKEVTEGVGDTGIKTGVLKVATGANQITEYEDLFLQAAARVSAETDVHIITHTQNGTMGSEQARRLTEYGAKADHIMIGHLDNCTDMDELLKIMEQGVYGGFDRLGIQGFTGALPESRRLAEIVGLAGSGYADRLILSHDSIIRMLGDPWVYSEQDAKDLANWNWTHVFEDILPALIKMGLSPETVEHMVTTNPQNFFGA
ncbi:MAG: phosphotriesterase-related protein [Eubacterium sp.]|jgi:Predicted metal-dependent hydrolase with the TIM-barrel fold|nr:phosphotriesterase-related protein [Eubacterium sp.]